MQHAPKILMSLSVYIELILTNRNRSLQNFCVIDTGLSDFHKMTVTILRSYLNKLWPKIIQCRDYKKFSNDAFKSELVIENGNLQNCNDLDSFLAKCKNVLNRTAPLKQKYVITVHLLKTLYSRQLRNKQDWKINLLSVDVKETKEPIMRFSSEKDKKRLLWQSWPQKRH